MMYPQYNNPYQMQNNGMIYPQAQAPNNPMPIQNTGFIAVHSEAEARNYPVAHGNSVTFKDENAPFVYVKTMGFSQLDRPTFERFRLVKEAAETGQDDTLNVSDDNTAIEELKGDIEAIKGDIEGIRKQIKSISPKKRPVKEIIEDDEDE